MSSSPRFNSNRFIDITGQTFGRWTVLEFGHWEEDKKGNNHAFWLCQCSCDKKTIREVNGSSLRRGKSKSCGCYSAECSSERNSKDNKYELHYGYYVGYTNNNEKFYIDLEDYDLVKDYCWYKSKDGYLYTHANDNKHILMHRLIMGVLDNPELIVDHIKHNTLDNRKKSLRVVTKAQNCRNSKLHSNNTSGVTGVSYRKDTNKWTVRIVVDGKKINLGCYENLEDAKKARLIAEDKYFGEHSYNNSMEEKEII